MAINTGRCNRCKLNMKCYDVFPEWFPPCSKIMEEKFKSTNKRIMQLAKKFESENLKGSHAEGAAIDFARWFCQQHNA